MNNYCPCGLEASKEIEVFYYGKKTNLCRKCFEKLKINRRVKVPEIRGSSKFQQEIGSWVGKEE